MHHLRAVSVNGGNHRRPVAFCSEEEKASALAKYAGLATTALQLGTSWSGQQAAAKV